MKHSYRLNALKKGEYASKSSEISSANSKRTSLSNK